MLNQTQRNTLRFAIKTAVDGIIDAGLVDQLENCIAPNQLTMIEAIKVFDETYLNSLIQNRKIPAEIRAAWEQLKQLIENGQNLNPDLLKTLQSQANHDPSKLADLQVFQQKIESLPESPRNYLIRLREAFLEMTPLNEYCYGPNYRSFQFRIGTVPFNLNQFGPIPIAGEIAEDVKVYVAERIEIELEHQKIQRNLIEQQTQLQEALRRSQQNTDDMALAIDFREQELNQFLTKHEQLREENQLREQVLTAALETNQSSSQQQLSTIEQLHKSLENLEQQLADQEFAQKLQEEELNLFQQESYEKQNQLNAIGNILGGSANTNQNNNQNCNGEVSSHFNNLSLASTTLTTFFTSSLKSHTEVMRKLAADLDVNYDQVYHGCIVEQTLVGIAGVYTDQASALFRRNSEGITYFILNFSSDLEFQKFLNYYQENYRDFIITHKKLTERNAHKIEVNSP
jgi:DNA segregation ATPase FtsK/SpoIIIE-like protein